MRLINFGSIVSLIICPLVLVLTTSALALSRHNHAKNLTNHASFTNDAINTEIALANSFAANFGSNLRCAFHEDTSSLIPSRSVLHQPSKHATTRIPNFSAPIRRARQSEGKVKSSTEESMEGFSLSTNSSHATFPRNPVAGK